MATRAALLTRARRFFLSLPFLIIAGLVLLYALAGFFLAPYLIKREIPRFAQERLGAQASLAEARVNPFLLKVELKGLKLQESEKAPLLAFDRLFVDLEASSLFRWAWTFSDIVLERPQFDLDIDPKGQLNLARILGRLKSPGAEPKPKEEGGPVRMVIHRAAVVHGVVALSDRSDATPANASVDPIDFELHEISTLPEHGGDYTLAARLPAGASLSWRGRLSLQPVASSGEISVRDLKAATVWAFLRDELRLEEPKGALTLGLRYDVNYRSGALQAAASNISLRAKDLALTPRGAKAPILVLRDIDLPGGTADYAKRAVQFPKLHVGGGQLVFAADESGASNWQSIVVNDEGGAKPAQKPDGAKSAPWRVGVDQIRVEDIGLRYTDASRLRPLLVEAEKASADLSLAVETGEALTLVLDRIGVRLTNPRIGSIDEPEPLIALQNATATGGKVNLAARSASIERVELTGGTTRLARDAKGTLPLAELFTAKTPRPDEGEPLGFTIGQIALSGHALAFSDAATEPAIAIDLTDTSLKLEQVAARAEQPLKFDFAAKVSQGGSLRGQGSYDGARGRADAQLEVTRVSLKPVEPLLSRYVVLKLASGSASAKGRVTWTAEGKDAGVRYAGTAAIHDLLLNEPGGDRFLSWKTLTANGVRLNSQRNRYRIDDVQLVEPGAKLVVNKDRTVNVSDVLRDQTKTTSASPATAAVPAPAAQAPVEEKRDYSVVVNRVRVEKGTLDFADLSLVLPFATQIRALGGAITGLSSESGSSARVRLEGQVQDYGLARIGGTINPFAPKAHTDIRVAFRNVEMQPFSPYTATFAGRKIASGRLNLDLQYKLNDSQLEGENKIVLEHFTLGERVESPSALDLPLDLAIALLTDSDGRIDVAVPVKGNVDNPQFSYGHLIGQAIRTLLARVVSAPFRAIGALFGGAGGADAEKLQQVTFDPGRARLLPPELEKLAKVAEAMKARPQLKLVVQGRYDPERDGRALRAAALRRELAERLGSQPEPGEAPGPITFNNAKTQRAVEALLVARSGEDAPAQFAAAFGKEKGREATRVNPILGFVGRASPDQELYQAMYRRLIELQPLPESALQELARARAEVIVKQLSQAGLPADRVATKDPEPSRDSISASLTLAVSTQRAAAR
jgi:uncharacterized protein involved in outer membrane biogenesis